MKITLAILLLLLMTSCATIFCGSKKRIVLESNMTEAKVITVDGNKYRNVTFPFPVKIRRGFNETIIKGEVDGYAPSVLTINKDFNAVSVINFFNLIGWGIDAATGAMMKPKFKSYELFFEPINK